MKKKFKMLVLGLSFMLCSNFAFASENNIQNPNQNQNNPQQNEQDDEAFFEKLKENLSENKCINNENNKIKIFGGTKYISGEPEPLFNAGNDDNENKIIELDFDIDFKELIKNNFQENAILKFPIRAKRNNTAFTSLLIIYFGKNLKDSQFEICKKNIQKKLRRTLLNNDCFAVDKRIFCKTPRFVQRYFYGDPEHNQNKEFESTMVKHFDEALNFNFEKYKNSDPNDNNANKFEFDILTSVNKKNKLPKLGRFCIEFKDKNNIEINSMKITDRDLPEDELKPFYKNLTIREFSDFFINHVIRLLKDYGFIQNNAQYIENNDFSDEIKVEVYDKDTKMLMNMGLKELYKYVLNLIEKKVENCNDIKNIIKINIATPEIIEEHNNLNAVRNLNIPVPDIKNLNVDKSLIIHFSLNPESKNFKNDISIFSAKNNINN